MKCSSGIIFVQLMSDFLLLTLRLIIFECTNASKTVLELVDYFSSSSLKTASKIRRTGRQGNLDLRDPDDNDNQGWIQKQE